MSKVEEKPFVKNLDSRVRKVDGYIKDLLVDVTKHAAEKLDFQVKQGIEMFEIAGVGSLDVSFIASLAHRLIDRLAPKVTSNETLLAIQEKKLVGEDFKRHRERARIFAALLCSGMNATVAHDYYQRIFGEPFPCDPEFRESDVETIDMSPKPKE